MSIPAGKAIKKVGKGHYRLSFLTPIMASIVFSAVFTFLTINAIYLPTIGFISELQGGIAAAAVNAVILSVLPFLGGLIILAMLRRRRRLLLKVFIGIGFLLAGFVVFSLILASALIFLFSGITGELAFVVAIPSSLVLNVVLIYSTLSTRVPQRAKNAASLLYGGAIGTLLGTTLPLWTGLLMVMGISIYDIYSVRRGPIKQIVKVSKEEEEYIPGLSYVSSDWEIGLGDLGIYSMLVSLALAQFGPETGPIVCIFSMLGVFTGSLLTLQLLKKREFLPGLPLTSLIGAIPIVIFMILSL